jgi:DNA-binding sugar fermentation-stimulating protein
MRFDIELVQGTFLRRLNRFAVEVQSGENTVTAHMANSGRLGEFLVRGRPCYYLPARSSERKTKYDLALVETESGELAAADSIFSCLMAQSNVL